MYKTILYGVLFVILVSVSIWIRYALFTWPCDKIYKVFGQFPSSSIPARCLQKQGETHD